MVIGAGEKFASALISPNFVYLHDWCSQRRIVFQDNEDLIEIPEVMAQLHKEVVAINKTLGEHEEIKRFRLVSDEWTPQTGELSPTLKLRRNYVADKYKSVIDEIYLVSKTQNGSRFRLPKINLNFDINEFIKRLKL
jgi:long-chain acyl-CoA synthetase